MTGAGLRRLLTACCAAAAITLAATACTSSRHPVATVGSGVSLGNALSTSAPPTTDTAPDTATATVPTTSAPASTTPPRSSAAAAALPKDTCTMAQLAVRMIRGGADTGREIGLLTFTNTSKVECSMFGFPGVSLRLGGAGLASPAERDTAAARATVHLAPGATAQAQFTDFSSCQSPLSDNVRVYPPNLTQFVDRPGQFRGCKLVVEPVVHS